MEKELVVAEILDALNWQYDDIARKKHGSFPGWTKGDLVTLIVEHETGPEIAKAYGVGVQAFNRTVKDILSPILGQATGGNVTWKLKLLSFTKLKTCSNCNEIKPFFSFSKDTYKYNDLDSLCKECKSIKNKSSYEINKDNYHKPYIEEHRLEYNARNAKRRAAKLQRTVPWSDLDKIKEFYNRCPTGYHVDHIVPLQGELVSGLHVYDNLQYLSAEENLKKGNKFCEIGGIR